MKSGILLINKPINISSFFVVKKIKKLLPRRAKVGHAGTLDPFAQGVLIVCLGREATRLVPKLMELPKTYHAKALLGEMTDTLDTEGEVVERSESGSLPSFEELEHALEHFMPSYTQTPPLYSALKHHGTPLYKLVRQKALSQESLEKIVNYKKREISIYSARMVPTQHPHFTLEACVSQGTYIRTLMNDIARKCGSMATTIELTRSAIGPFILENCISLDTLSSYSTFESHIYHVEDILKIVGTH